MTTMYSVLAVLCVAVAAQAELDQKFVTDILETKGAQYELYKTYTEKINFDADPKVAENTHKGLNIKRDDETVNKADLELFYWHKDTKFAVPRFFRMIDDNKDDNIEVSELGDDLKKKHFIVALSECQYLRSKGLKQSCYADQILTYVALTLGPNHVKAFYKYLDKDGSGKIDENEVNNIASQKNKDKEITAEELGAYYGNDGVTEDELTDYVTQESILDDFRGCRDSATETVVSFKNDCLLDEVVEYTNDDLTDMDIAVLFRAIDKDENGFITMKELEFILPEAKIQEIKDIMEIIDMSSTRSRDVDFGELRTYLRSPTVLIQMERVCTVPKTTQKEEIECIFTLFKSLIKDEHDPIWLVVPDLDQLITFEIFDKTDDGVINKDELKTFPKFTEDATVNRFFKEADSDDNNVDDIDLEEFNEYADIPHMVYGTGDCLLTSRKQGDKRGECFTTEVGDVIENFKFVENEAIEQWFNTYDKDQDGFISEAKEDQLKEKLGGDVKLVDLFLEELGQGGNLVSHFEFDWYVKQQDFADCYEDKKIVQAETKSFDDAQLKSLDAELKLYIEEEMTEFDIEEFFDILDADDDHDIDIDDFKPNPASHMIQLLELIDKQEADGDEDTPEQPNVNYREFWLWLNNDAQDGNQKIKNIFEKECTKPEKTHFAEIYCYVKTFKNPEKFTALTPKSQ